MPTARRLSSNVANSRFRAFRESIRAQEKVPTHLYEYALWGTRTHEILLVGDWNFRRRETHETQLLRCGKGVPLNLSLPRFGQLVAYEWLCNSLRMIK